MGSHTKSWAASGYLHADALLYYTLIVPLFHWLPALSHTQLLDAFISRGYSITLYFPPPLQSLPTSLITFWFHDRPTHTHTYRNAHTDTHL